MVLDDLRRSTPNVDLRWWYLRVGYSFADDVQRRSIAGIDAQFHVDTFREYRRVLGFTGERGIIEDIVANVEPDDVFYDVGANVGTHSCFVGQVASKVVAFEPHPPTARRLRENLELNGVRATVCERALSDHEGTAELALPADSAGEVGTGEFSLRTADGPQEAVEVSVVVGDEFVAAEGLPTPDVAKIDVEGAEERVIGGLRETLADCRLVYCEVHHEFVDVGDVVDRLEAIGFACDTGLQRGDSHTFVKARRD